MIFWHAKDIFSPAEADEYTTFPLHLSIGHLCRFSASKILDFPYLIAPAH